MDRIAREICSPPATRRAILAALASSAGAALWSGGLAAQDSPTPVPDQARLDAFVALSEALVGGGRIDPKRAGQFLDLNDATDDDRVLLDAMLSLSPAAVAASPAEHPLVNPILIFWYVGEFKGAPVAGRDTFWYGLSSWQAIRYTSSTGICKRFGDWTEAPNVT
ncbi:MAG: hypothetical protein ACKOWF_13605 [Chloroflexota bacterium]